MISRVSMVIRGAVQGVGFRPFVYNLAIKMGMKGYVLNSSSGVYIEAENHKELLNEFIIKIENEKPVLAVITGLEFSFLDPINYETFEIRESEIDDDFSALIIPDIAICDECKKELLNPSDRRYRYPFINCTNCGPRFSIIEALPYDRPNTSMKIFKMCVECKKEYENPADRRFHAQPVACPRCGPQLALWDALGNILSTEDNALQLTFDKIKEGKIIALKGLGGFQLIADASNEKSILLLRKLKQRDEKPFALMFKDIESVKKICEVSLFEERLLQSPESPIVLLKRKFQSGSEDLVNEFIAPGNPYLGIMLPYTPLHILLMESIKNPIIATSANISEEPICIDNFEALERLNGIAEFFLVHNRPISRQADDSIARVILGKQMIIRRARGYAPMPLKIHNTDSNDVVLAVGGHLKNTIALKIKGEVIISQHIGNLSTAKSYNTFLKVIEDFNKLYHVRPNKIISDRHPEYLSTKFAKSSLIPFSDVQHHFAHIASCRGENQITGRTLGISWDGTGFGEDNSVWGGEFFISDDHHYAHFAQLRKFYLPGGETAVKEPRRSALGILYSIYEERLFEEKAELISDVFEKDEIKVLKQMLNKKINTPLTSSAGRLFDAVSSLLNLVHINNYEGQAGMSLEFAIGSDTTDYYPFEIHDKKIFIIDWQPLIKELLIDKFNKVPVKIISAKFHNTLGQIILSAAKITDDEKVVLSGGCFQNASLLERTVELLQNEGHKVYWHQRVPTNDGGLSLGQIFAMDIISVPLNYFYGKQKLN